MVASPSPQRLSLGPVPPVAHEGGLSLPSLERERLAPSDASGASEEDSAGEPEEMRASDSDSTSDFEFLLIPEIKKLFNKLDLYLNLSYLEIINLILDTFLIKTRSRKLSGPSPPPRGRKQK